MNRREFVVLSGAGLTLGLIGRFASAVEPGTTPIAGAPFSQPFLRIDTDGRVTVLAKHLEMGQGIWTGLALIVAEELDAAWSQIRVEGAPANLALYKNSFGIQATGGSISIANSWDQLRRAGATARSMLVDAAAARWGVSRDRLVVADGVVREPTGRTAGFGELAAAAAMLPPPADVALKDPKTFKLIGHSPPRLDTASKSNGTALFANDIRRPNMKVAMLARAPQFGATLKSIDDREALKIPGVRQIVGIPREHPKAVAIIADDTWSAWRAKRALVLAWDDSAAETRSSDQLFADFRAQSRTGPSISCLARGDVALGFAHASRIVEAEYELPYLAHQAMEPIVSVGELRDGACDIWAATQNVTADHKAAIQILGLEPDRVRLHTLYSGGSFGRRATFDADWVSEMAHVLKATDGRWTIRLMWTREDDMRGGYYRPMSHHRMRAALAADGRMLAVEQTIVAQSFLFPQPTAGSAPSFADPLVYQGVLGTRYAVPLASVRWVHPRVVVPVQTYRALSFNHTTVTKELFIETAARAAGVDAVAYRLLHLDLSDRGQARQANVLRKVAERSGWWRPRVAGTALGIAVQESQGSFVAQAAQVRIVDGVPKVERVTCAIDCGLAVDPDSIRAQMDSGIAFGISMALHGAITLDHGHTVQGNFNDQPVVRMDEMPRIIDVEIVESTFPPSGVGEPCSVPIVSAIANAVAQLTGKPIHRLPIVLQA